MARDKPLKLTGHEKAISRLHQALADKSIPEHSRKFARSLCDQYAAKNGHLSQKQWDWVHRLA